jgi:hypothetical protein
MNTQTAKSKSESEVPRSLADKKRNAGAVKVLFQKLGPGLITGASDDDPSGIGAYSQVGAQFGYSLLWTMMLTYPLMTADSGDQCSDWKGHRDWHRRQSSEKLSQARSLLCADRGVSSKCLQFGRGHRRHGSGDAFGTAGKGRSVHCIFWCRVAGRSVVGSVLNVCQILEVAHLVSVRLCCCRLLRPRVMARRASRDRASARSTHERIPYRADCSARDHHQSLSLFLAGFTRGRRGEEQSR